MRNFRPSASRGFLAALVLLSAAALAGCSGSTPAKTAQNYTDGLKLYNYPGCYQLLSHQDQLDRTIDQFLTDVPLAPNVSREWFRAVLHAYDYQVGDTKQEGDSKAVVTVKITRPDLALWERTVDAQLGPSDTPDSLAQKQLNENSYPKVTYDDNIVAVKEGSDWRILVDFPAKEAIAKKHKEAIDAYHKHDYDKAISTYQGIIQDLDKEEATGNAGLKSAYQRELDEIQAVKSQIPEAQAYVPKLALSDVDMKMGASRVPGIFGKITNSGDKGIDEVVCTVTYYEGKGKKRKAVATEEHTIIATPLEFINFSRPVLPFVPGETRNFGFKLTAPADVQQRANPDMEITGIVFTQSKAPLPKPQAAPGASPSAAASPAAAAAGAAAPPPPPPPPPPPAAH
ncbi:MAG TPA: hypothetical protein VEF03_03960 [Candidatus Binataceae bacterium]|nr:hypothetical protein [Candidatus Binataceae bacterium]